MATADLTSYDRATRSRDGSLADGVFISAAMAGAVCGGLAGTGVSASALPGFDPTVVGTLGVVLGSIVAGALGRYVAFPLWAALFSSDKR